jgi:hypothetical protein
MADQTLTNNDLRDYAKFNGINFPQWRYGVMLKLRRKKLEKIVLGTEQKPTEVKAHIMVIPLRLESLSVLPAFKTRDVIALHCKE